MKKKDKLRVQYIIVLSLLILGVGIYNVIKANNAYKLDTNDVISSHSYYTLKSNATEYQKELFNVLTQELEKDTRNDSLLSELIVKNFIADYYTWTNKSRYNEVTAAQFIDESVQSTFYNVTLDTFYNDLGYYINLNKQKETLEIEDVNTQVKAIKFDIYGLDDSGKIDEEIIEETIDAFLVEATWSYKETGFDTKSYQKSGYFVVVKKDKLYSILESGQEWEVTQNEE